MMDKNVSRPTVYRADPQWMTAPTFPVPRACEGGIDRRTGRLLGDEVGRFVVSKTSKMMELGGAGTGVSQSSQQPQFSCVPLL